MTFNATHPTQTYTYDQENRLTGAMGTLTRMILMATACANRMGIWQNGTLYWYMTQGIVAESDLAGTITSEYVFFNADGSPGGNAAFQAEYSTAGYSITSQTVETASVITILPL